jgi:hypothetical protein
MEMMKFLLAMKLFAPTDPEPSTKNTSSVAIAFWHVAVVGAGTVAQMVNPSLVTLPSDLQLIVEPDDTRTFLGPLLRLVPEYRVEPIVM